MKARLYWTARARSDLHAIRDFVAQDSPHYAGVVVGRLLDATQRLELFPRSGREVPELGRPDVREVIEPPYRIVYHLVSERVVHVVTVHHSARRFPSRPLD